MILCRHSFRSQPGPGGFLKFQIKYGLRCHREKPYPVQRISTTFGLSFFLRSGNSRFPMGMRDGIKAIATFLAPGMKLLSLLQKLLLSSLRLSRPKTSIVKDRLQLY
ncbi:hypothetical protein Salat_2996200 [Sesamum alatum]|uniref:Uncharacterized protein n=1 Tax=Sesamum alatum TaxID=300844 RepID=A0AAE1XIB8_9LAMI|nr:hypothetical protein Salat_2996200 [Sesamum alatum]